MTNRYDEFEDFLEGQQGGGILNSAGLDDFEGISTKVERDGVAVTLNCRLCNKKRKVTLEWPEVIVIGENQQGVPPILPQGWQVSPNNYGTVYTQLQCPNCGGHGFAVHTTPEEARMHVKSAMESRILPQHVVAQIVQRVRQQRGG